MGHTRSSKKTLIVRHKQGRKHITNCKAKQKGYYRESKKFTQIHHIVCLAAMTDARIAKYVTDKGKMEFIRECLKLTKWNINDAGDVNAHSNVVGLPLKLAFVKKPGAEWDGWPCHQVEHNPLYTKAVCDQMYKEVWFEVLKLRKKCQDCQKECLINAKALEDELSDQSESWYEFLDDRGKEEGGTAVCWRDRWKPEKKAVWYKPFSMALDPKPRKPPKDWEDLGGTLRNYLSKLMFT
jgi:hypothetical protein